jgi:hypothetical protein
MTPTNQREARVLIVVTRDHGEFSLAMSFLRGQRLARRATMLLPDNLYLSYRASAGIPAIPYVGSDDILAAVDAAEPDIVCLFSGYLFEQGHLLSPESLNQLLQRLRDRGCRIVTSDPFLGLASGLTLGQIDTRMLASGQTGIRRWLTRLVVRWRGLGTPVVRVPALEEVIHLYPTSVPLRPDGVERLSFFNPATIRLAIEPEQPDSGRHWLFVLSATDLQCQRTSLGIRKFTALLAGMLWHTEQAGRLPTLIAPRSIVRLVARHLPEAELLTACPFDDFQRRLLDAEYVFFWNAFSFSHLARVANELPLFLFDRGHLARTIKPFYDVARACHFGGWELPYLDQQDALDADALRELATAQRPVIRALRESWEASPTPDKIVERLVSEGRASATGSFS